jgi:hypothetical protein
MIKKIFNGLYEVSTNGDIITHNWRNSGKTAILKPATDKKGYLRVGLQIKGKLRTQKVHRLVALAFIPNPENKPQVNHKNSIKSDNNIKNLEWVTNRENVIHSVLSGNCKYVKLTPIKVKEIRELYSSGNYTQKSLGLKYGVIRQHISDIINFKKWNHI